MGSISIRWVAAFAVVLPFGLPPAARAQDATVAEQTVEVMHKLWGKHPGMRANHAKGVVVEGSFEPSPAGAKLSKASLFQGAAVPVTARFSDATGLPDIADNSGNAAPNGLAVRFHLAGGGEMDMVLNTLAFFPVANGAEFRDLLQAVSVSGKDAAKPTALDRFFAAHPAAPLAFGSAKTPASFAQAGYNGIDAFIFVDEAGKRQPFRVRVEPVDGVMSLTADEAAKQPADYLVAGLAARLPAKPIKFHFKAQLAKASDDTKDPTKPWPADRDMVDLGIITLNKVAANNAAVAKSLVFMPNNLPAGVEVSDDPLIDARVQAYAVSFGERAQ